MKHVIPALDPVPRPDAATSMVWGRDIMRVDPLTLEEVAFRLAVSLSTVERLIRSENGSTPALESIKLLDGAKSNRRVTQGQLKRFLDRREIASMPQARPRPRTKHR